MTRRRALLFAGPGVGAAGLLGFFSVLARCGWPRGATIVLALYGSLGLYGLAHYARAPVAQHALAMNATIVVEAATGAVLALAATLSAVKHRPRDP